MGRYIAEISFDLGHEETDARYAAIARRQAEIHEAKTAGEPPPPPLIYTEDLCCRIVDTEVATGMWEGPREERPGLQDSPTWEQTRLYRSSKGNYYTVTESDAEGSPSVELVTKREAASWLLSVGLNHGIDFEIPADLSEEMDSMVE